MIGVARTASLSVNWNRLFEITQSLLGAHDTLFGPDQVRRTESDRYRTMLADLEEDRQVVHGTVITLLGLYRAPASKNRHHNVEGGLVRHMLEMWELWLGMRNMLREHGAHHLLLTDRNVWKCILHHDLNKVWKYKLVSDTPWKVDYANEDDTLTYVLGDTHKVIALLAKHNIQLTVPFHNALITSEGGYSPGPRPKAESVLAKVAYLLDDMSANVVDRLQTNRFWDSKEGGLGDI